MSAGMLRHVDQLNCLARAKQSSFGYGVRFSRQRNDATVVIAVHLVIEHPDAWDFAHGLDQRVDLRCVAALAEIRHTLNQSFHEKVTEASNETLSSSHAAVADANSMPCC